MRFFSAVLIVAMVRGCGGGGGPAEDADADDAFEDPAGEADATNDAGHDPDAQADADPAEEMESECPEVCPPDGARRCDGQTIQACAPDGSGCASWSDVVTCSDELGACNDLHGMALCCPPPAAGGAFTLPAHTIWVTWDFGAAAASTIEADIRMENDPGDTVGLYLSPMNGTIDGTTFYLGIQTNLLVTDGGWIGNGVIFSRWDSQDPADIRTAPGGYAEVGSSEGLFISTRIAYPWTTGSYRMRLQRAEPGGDGDWFDLYVVDGATGVETFAGGLRFSRRDPAVPASIAPSFTTFTEVYYNATDYSQVPLWTIAMMAYADGALASSASSEYPAWPTAEFPNADCWYDEAADLVHLHFGGGTSRCNPAGTLFRR